MRACSFATFPTMPSALFTVGTLGQYRKGTDYSFTVLTKLPSPVTFNANVICFGVNVNSNYRSYDQGEHWRRAMENCVCLKCVVLSTLAVLALPSRLFCLSLLTKHYTGLHMGDFGDANAPANLPCHINNDPNMVAMKSHITTGGPTGSGSWYTSQLSFLNTIAGYAVTSNRIAVWVR
jgi:hypothetical protein